MQCLSAAVSLKQSIACNRVVRPTHATYITRASVSKPLLVASSFIIFYSLSFIAGFVCPSYNNPPDFFLDVITNTLQGACESNCFLIVSIFSPVLKICSCMCSRNNIRADDKMILSQFIWLDLAISYVMSSVRWLFRNLGFQLVCLWKVSETQTWV